VASAAIETRGLTKYYGPVVGLENLSLEVAQGEVFGFLGANGAGKTTTIRILLDLVRPTSGSASILGFDCHRQGLEARRRVGYLPGDMPFYPELTGAQYLRFLSSLGDTRPSPSQMEFLLRRFDVSDLDLNRRMRDYSHGMKRKLGLIQALMTEPQVLILDEPTSGLDPLMIEAFSETVDELARSGHTTVFLSSHILSEVDRICQRIGLVRGGRLVAVRTLSELRAAAPRRMTVMFSVPVNGDMPALPGATLVTREPARWVLDVQGPLGDIIPQLGHLPVVDVQLAAFTLDETILRLLGHVQKDRPVHKDGAYQAASKP
jgi:ABC-2 type transport system ATP-binding protein